MDTIVAYYTKDKKVYHYYPTQSEINEMEEKKAKWMYAMSYSEKMKREQDALDHKGGYCPKCFLLKPINGVCNNCGE